MERIVVGFDGSEQAQKATERAAELVQEAEESGADLIVVGTRGLNAAKRLVLGSVSTNVVQHAPCDVLVVR
jgi:nucleotide-binding universal stress UspA family protein